MLTEPSQPPTLPTLYISVAFSHQSYKPAPSDDSDTRVGLGLMSNTSVGTGRDHTNEIRRLSTLLEVSQALSGVLNLKAALQSVLDLLERRHQVVGGTIFLLDADT